MPRAKLHGRSCVLGRSLGGVCWCACVGMPYPANVETAMEVEGIVRSHGAVPATIAIMDGQLCVGLEEEQLEHLGRHGPATRKCSRCPCPRGCCLLARLLDA